MLIQCPRISLFLVLLCFMQAFLAQEYFLIFVFPAPQSEHTFIIALKLNYKCLSCMSFSTGLGPCLLLYLWHRVVVQGLLNDCMKEKIHKGPLKMIQSPATWTEGIRRPDRTCFQLVYPYQQPKERKILVEPWSSRRKKWFIS